jgi:hypothetical protein
MSRRTTRKDNPVRPASRIPTIRASDRPWAQALRAALVGQHATWLQRIAERCADEAAAGDMAAIREIGARLDGKVSDPANTRDVAGKRLIEQMSDDELAVIAAGGRAGVSALLPDLENRAVDPHDRRQGRRSVDQDRWHGHRSANREAEHRPGGRRRRRRRRSR